MDVTLLRCKSSANQGRSSTVPGFTAVPEKVVLCVLKFYEILAVLLKCYTQ